MLVTPEMKSDWISKIQATAKVDRHELIRTRPIIAWYSSRLKRFRLLIKLSNQIGDDSWIIQGRNTESDRMIEITTAITSLDEALHCLRPEIGWVPCEFESEIDFHTATLAYLSQEPKA